MRVPLLVFLLLLLACGDSRLRPSVHGVEWRPDGLGFPDTYVGASRAQELVLLNTGRAPVRVLLHAPAPFQVGTPELTLAGGASSRVQVRYAPERPETSEAVLSLVVEGTARELPLRATALAAPVCVPESPCHTSRFDAESGTCQQALVPEGSACGSACLTDARCGEGVCRGTPVSCDDGDLCTVDGCDPLQGCVHPPVSCAPPSDPCRVARCEPGRGCVEEVARDGTACGPSDCLTSHVCLAGRCEVRSTPEGARCGEATPCQAAGSGRCREKQCVRPPPTALSPVWSHHAAGGRGLLFHGAVDEAGNLYWVETPGTSGASGTELVSADRDGRVRYRVGGAETYSAEAYGHGYLFGWPFWSWSEGRRADTGERLWYRELWYELGYTTAGYVRGWRMDGPGRVFAGGWEHEAGYVHFAAEPATGRLLWRRVFREGGPVVLGDDGHLYTTTVPCWDPRDAACGHFALSLGADGVERWRRRLEDEGRADILLAERGVLFRDGSLLSAGDGRWLGRLDFFASRVGMSGGPLRPVVVGEKAWTVGCRRGDCPVPPSSSPPPGGHRLLGFDVRTGALAHEVPLSSARYLLQPHLHSGGGVAFIAEHEGRVELRVHDAEGRERVACPLEVGPLDAFLMTWGWAPVSVVHGDRLFLYLQGWNNVQAVYAFELPVP